MGLGSVFSPLGNMFTGVFAKVMAYAWITFPLIIVVALGVAAFIFKMVKGKKTQWTHKLKVRRVLHGGQLTHGSVQNLRLSDPVYIKMRRFPLIKKAEVFELEKPLLGGYLLPELDQYSGENEFSIILDIDNRIYTNQGEFFDPNKHCVMVSAKHAEIDIQRSNLKADFQNINKTSKRIEWAEIAKWAFLGLAMIVAMIIIIVGLSNWGDAQQHKATAEQAKANAMQNLADAMTTVESVVNTQKLEILPMWKDFYGTQNIQGVINKPYNATN